MADFVAVLRKTIDGLGDTSPEMRRRVYDKARATIADKLAALDPPPPASVAERQRKALEDAVVEIEASFAAAAPARDAPDPLAELEMVFASLNSKPAPVLSGSRKEVPKTAPRPPVVNLPRAGASAAETPPEKAKPEAMEKPAATTENTGTLPSPPAFIKRSTPPAFPPRVEQPIEAQQLSNRGEATAAPETGQTGGGSREDFAVLASPMTPVEETLDDRSFPLPPPDEEILKNSATPRRRPALPVLPMAIAAAIALFVIGGLYVIWTNKEQIASLVSSGENQATATQSGEPSSGLGVLPPPEAPPASPQQSDEPQAPKYTQRLNTDGSEVDVGPSNGAVSIGEGTSVAPATSAQNVPGEATTNDHTAATGAPGEVPTGEAPPAGGVQNAAPPAASLAPAVEQNAIFYEERAGSSAGSAESGSVVWSVVQESPGNDLPPEPAIRGEAIIPNKDLQLRMTIRRNADQTLPASHIIELIFLTPESFGGGGIDNILRFTLKDTEEAPGNPVRGIPAKIADGFFLIALDESVQEMETNLNLLRQENWIDIPVIYKSGRRALITLEKGLQGTDVFNEAMQAWQEATPVVVAPEIVAPGTAAPEIMAPETDTR